jgi:tetratricopeptide (TPR) repeat protein
MRYEGYNRWEELIEALDRESESKEGRDAGRISLRIGKIYDDFLVRKGEAMAYYQKAVKQDPACTEALARAQRIYQQMGKVTMVSRLMDIELKTSENAAAAGQIYFSKGWLSIVAGEYDEALQHFKQSLGFDPSLGEAEDMIGDLATGDDLFNAGMQIEDQLRTVTTSETRKVAGLFKRAAVFYRRDGETENALRCLRQSCMIYPDDAISLLLYESTILENNPDDVQRVYALYDELINASGDDLIRHPRLLDYASRVLLRFEDQAQAFKYLRQSLDIKPDLEGAYLFVTQMLESVPDGYAQAAKYAERAADASVQADARLFYLREALNYYQEKIGDGQSSDRIRQEIEKSTEEEPEMSRSKKRRGDETTVEGTPDVSVSTEFEVDEQEDFPETSESMPDQPQVETGASESVVLEEEASVVVESGPEVSEEVTTDEPPPAREPAAGPMEDDEDVPADPVAAFQSVWEEPDDALVKKIEEAQSLESDKPDRALYAWRGVVDGNPKCSIGFEGIMRTSEATGKWNYAIEAHKKLASALEDDVRMKNRVILSMASIYRDKMNQETSSISLYQQVIKSDPTNRAATEQLLGIYSKLNRWPDYVKLLAVKAENARDPAAQLELTLEVASLYLDKFNNQGEAIKHYERALELDPQNDTATQYLLDMYEKRRDWEKYIKVSLSLIEDNLEGNLEKLKELARLADERVRKPAVSIELWEKVYAIDSGNDEAIGNLAQMYERDKSWEKLGEMLKLQAQRTMDENEKKAVLVKLGLIYTDKLGDDQAGVDVWKEILTIDPNERRAMEQLKKRYVALLAWDDLEQLIESTGRWDEMIRLLEGRAKDDDVDVDRKKEIFYRVAHVWRDRAEKPERTTTAYEKILELDPDDVEAAEALIPIYEERKAYQSLASVLEIKLKHTDDAVERFELLLRIAAIYRSSLSDPATAFDWYVRAFKENPLDVGTADALEETTGEAGKWEDLIENYRQVVDEGDRVETIPVSLRMGNVIFEKLGKNDEALGIYEGILEIKEDHEEALEKIENIYSLMGRYEELQGILQRRLDLTLDPDKKLAIRRKMASIYVEALGDRPKAIEAFNRILEEVGDDLETLRSLGLLYEAEEQWEELIATYERQMALQEPGSEGFIGCLFNVGKIYEMKLGNIEKAIDSYREILNTNPAYEAARQAMEALIGNEEYRGVVAEVLEPIFEKAEEWDGVVKCLEILADTSGEVFDKIGFLKRAGDLYIDKLGMPEKSFVLISQALRLDPSDEEMLGDIEQISEVLDAWKDLDELVAVIVQGDLDDDVKRNLWLRLAKIRHYKMAAESKRIIEAYGKVLELDPQDMEALDALEGLYQNTENWQSLLEVLRSKVENIIDEDQKKQIFFKMATIHDEMLGSPESSVEAYKEIISINPSEIPALKALESLYNRMERWSDLADNLLAQFSIAATPEDAIDLRLRLADLREKKMGEIESAIEIYRDVLGEDPTNARAVDALERLIQNESHERQVAELLEPIYRESRDWQKIVFIDEIFIKHSQDHLRNIELIKEIAELYEIAADNPDKAFQTLSRGILINPADEDIQANIERLARIINIFPQLVGVYEQAIEKTEDKELQILLHKKAAALCEIESDLIEKAVGHYKSILELDSANMDAIESLERMYGTLENYGMLADIYKRKARVVLDPIERKDLFIKAGQIYEEILDNVKEAVESYTSILEEDPEDVTAIDKIAALYVQQKMWQEFIDISMKKIDISLDMDEKKNIFREIGRVYLQEISDTDKAIDNFMKILEIDPEDRSALGTLDNIFTNEERWEDLLPIVEKEAEISFEPEETINLRYRIGTILKEHIGDVERALDVFQNILTVMPEHTPTITSLENLINEGKEPLASAKILEPIYEANADWNKMVWCLEIQLSATEDKWEKVGLLHRIAGYQEDDRYLASMQDAFRTYSRALEIDARNEDTLSSIERISENLRNWQDLAREYDAVLEKVEEDEEKIIIGLRAARVYEEELNDVDSAIERFKLVTGVDPRNATAIHSLSRLYRINQKWEELFNVLELEAEIAAEDDERLNLKFEKAQICYQELNRIGDAIEIFREILDLNPDHRQTHNALELLFDEGVERKRIFEILAPLYENIGEWEKLCSRMETLVDETEELEERIDKMVEVASIYESKLLDGERAFDWYGRALITNPLDERAFNEMERLADTLGEWQKFADTLTNILSSAEQKEIKMKSGKSLASIMEQKLYDIDRARDVYVYLMDVDEYDHDVLDTLDRIYTAALDWEPLTGILRRKIEKEEDTDEKVNLLTRYGQIYLDELDNTEDSKKAFRAIVDDLQVVHRPALQGLEKIYMEEGSWKELFEICEKQLEIAESDEEMADIYGKIAQIASMGLDDPERSIELWNKVMEIKGDDPSALEALGELYEGLERYSDLVEILDRGLLSITDDSDRIRMFEKLGVIWSTKLGRDRNALECWDNILAIEPGNTRALLAKSDLYEKLEEWEDLIQTLELAGDVGIATLSDEEVKAIYARQAKVLDEKLDRAFDAIESWLKVLRVDPEDRQGLEALRELYSRQQMWEEYIGILSRLVPLSDPQTQIQLFEEIAVSWIERVGLPSNATDAYASILKIQPDNEDAFIKLEGLYKETDNVAALIQLYLDKYEVERDIKKRSDLLMRTARLYEESMNDEDSAFLLFQKAYLEDYRDASVIDEVERITAKTGRWEELIGVVNTKLAELGNRIEAVPLYLQVGKWYGERLGHLQYATAIYGKVLQMDPSNVGALSAIADLYKAAGQWDNYVHYLKMQIEKARSDDVRKEILVKLGKTYEDELNRVDDAMDTFRRVIEIDPLNKDALEALDEIYRGKEMYRELIDVLKKKIESLGPDAQEFEHEKLVNFLLDLGNVYEIQLQDPVKAVDAYRKVTEIDDTNMQALKGLERLFLSMEKLQDLLDVLEMQFNVTQIEKEKIDLLRRIAVHQEKDFLKPDLAIEKYDQILTIDPDNEDALENLERIFRNQKKWEDMVRTLERHIMVALDGDKKVHLLLTAGLIVLEELEDFERAIELYTAILDVDSSHPDALKTLAHLYEQTERYVDAYETMEGLLKVTLDPADRVELLYRMGVILDTQLGQRDEAIEKFQEALAIEPSHLESLGALRTIYINLEEWGMAAQILDVEQENTTVMTQKSELLYARGRILADNLARNEEAIECFREAIACDPENEQAAQPLVEYFLVSEMYAEAEPLLDMLLRKWADKPAKELLPYHLSQAKVASVLGNNEKALKAYKSAFEIEASNLEVIRGMAQTLYRMENWDKSFKYYQMILVQHMDTQNAEDKIDIYYHLGNIKMNLNEPRKALNMYEKALEIDKHHRLTLLALIGLFEKHKDYEQVIHFKKTIAETLEGEEKFNLLAEIGDIWQEKLNNPVKAIATYNDAMQYMPHDRTLLHKLMTLYSTTKQWAKAVDVLKQIADLEEDTMRQSRYYHSIAIIYHSEIKDTDSAIEYFNKALDSDPSNLKDFEAIEQILTPMRDWKQLERNYRKMLHRVAGKGNAVLEENLWHYLGEIYRTRMQNYEAAAEAFRMASGLAPDNMVRHEILAELYELMPERWEDAVKEHQFLLRQNPNRIESYKALRKIYQEARQYDRAWCMCSTLNFLKKADPDEKRFFEQYRMKGLPRAQQTLDNERWVKNLFHQDEDIFIGKVYEIITPIIFKRKVQPQKSYGLKKKDKKDPFTSTEAFARIFGTVVRVLNLPLPELYVRYDQAFGLQYAITEPPASVVGQALLTGYTPQDLTFIIAKHLAYYRGEHYIRLLEPTVAGLKTLLLASIRVANRNFQLPQDIASQITPVVQLVQSGLLPVQLEQLGKVVKAFLESKGAVDLKRWGASVELTACRVGLLLCNDLEVAVRMVNAEPPGLSDVPPKEKVKELILFSVAEEYFKLRQALGFSINV